MLRFAPYLTALTGHVINHLVDIINSVISINRTAHNSPYRLGQSNKEL